MNRHAALLVASLAFPAAAQAEAVQAAGGVVDKFIGDAVMAFWGPPFSAAETHAAQACHAALSQVAAMGTLRGELPELTGLRKDPPRLDMCVGLGTGEVVVGNIGSDQARSFTVIGDAVNRASRIEAVNRQYGTRILVDGATAQAAGGAFAFREVDALRFKGKSEVTHIYELRGLSTERNPETSALLETYAQALARYRARDWAGAEAGFLECLTRVPEDGPSRVLLQRVVQFKVEPPGSDWEGVHTLLEK